MIKFIRSQNLLALGRRSVCSLAAIAISVGIQVSPGSAAWPTKISWEQGAVYRTVWDGVYTEKQASAGMEIFESYCDTCHGEVIGGDGEFKGPELKGDSFFENWREDRLWSLYRKIRGSMPMFQPPLTDSEYLLIVAHILKENGLPSGDSELRVDELRTVRLEAMDGPKPLPTGSLIQTVGCLISVRGDWTLVMASQSVRNRNSDPELTATAEDLEEADREPIGALTFQLGNFFMLGDFNPAAHQGQRMLARGALIRRPNGDRISLTGLDMVASSCGPSGRN